MRRTAFALTILAIAVAWPDSPRGSHMVFFDVVHNGVTWTLQNEPIAHGTFIDGSPWVEHSAAIPIVVEVITPGPTTTASPIHGLIGCRVNGSVKNPNQTDYQGFDERAFADNNYNPGLFGLIFDKSKYLAVPITLAPGDSLVSAIHDPDPPVFGSPPNEVCNGPWIEAFGVLTVVGPGHGLTNGSHFRPYYGGPTKFPPRSAAGFFAHRLPQVLPAATFPVTPAKVTAMRHVPYVARGLNSTENQLTPSLWGPGYYRDMLGENAGWGENLLTLCNDADNATKTDLAIAMAQYGLDLDSAFRNGLVRGDLAHGYGRMIPIMLAGLLFGDTNLIDMLALANQYPVHLVPGFPVFVPAAAPLHRWYWNELADTYYYDPALLIPEWFQSDYQQSGGLLGPVVPAPPLSWGAGFDYYRAPASATLASQAVFARLCGLAKGIGWNPFLAYVDRYIVEASPGGAFASLDESYGDGDHYDAHVLVRGGIRQCTRGALEIGSLAGPKMTVTSVPTAGAAPNNYTIEINAPAHPLHVVLLAKSGVPNSTVAANGTVLLPQKGYLGAPTTQLIFLNPATHQFVLGYGTDAAGKVTIPVPDINEPPGCSYTLQAIILTASGEWIPTNALEITLQ